MKALSLFSGIGGLDIAAAPEMLAVLEELRESASYWSEYDVPLGIVERIEYAIMKARGEE